MKLIEPQADLWSEEQVTPEEHIARCARVCYGHENSSKDPQKLIDSLKKNGHLSMFRHASKYFVYKNVSYGDTRDEMAICPYNTVILFGTEGGYRNNTIWLSTNGQEYGYSDNFFYNTEPEAEITLAELLEHCRKQPDLFEIVRLTFCLTTQISTSRELNRVSPNNIAERSTRYCSSKDGLEICKPWWWNDDFIYTQGENRMEIVKRHATFYSGWKTAERAYKDALELGMKPQDARGVLPLDTATKVVYTYSVRTWKHILDLRYYGKTGRPHPNAKLIMGMVRDKINQFAHGIDYQV